MAHNGYYTAKAERGVTYEHQVRISKAQAADYKKHIQAGTEVEAKQMSTGSGAPAQYLPNVDRIKLEKIGLKEGVLVKQPGGSDYYIYQAPTAIGYNNGTQTKWLRVELTKAPKPEFHGHPISERDALQYLNKLKD